MTHEQKPESAEFRTREAQTRELCASCHFEEVATAHILEAEARGAAEQRQKDDPEFEKIVAERDDAEDFIRKMAEAVLGEVVEWSNVYGFQNALNDVSERIFFLEKDITNVTALEARVKELEERLHYLTGMGSDNSSSGPRIIDLCFTAFMRRAAGKNEDGGSCDWFNDTRPHIAKQIERIRAVAICEGGEHG